MKVVESIFNESQKTGNFDEMLKAFIYKMQFSLQINPDEATTLIKDFEKFAEKYTRTEQKALLHSMTAELYYMYYNNIKYDIQNRSHIVGYVPENMNEWSENLFFDKINKELNLSLSDVDTLQKMDVKQFALLIEQGEDSKTLQPTFYDFLAHRAITILEQLSDAALIKNPLNDNIYFLPANEFATISLNTLYDESAENQALTIYQSLIQFHQQTNDISALIYADLSRLNYLRRKSEHIQSEELYIKALEDIYKKQPTNETIISVMEEMAKYYLSLSKTTLEQENNYKKVAYDIAQKGIDDFPYNKQINALKNIQADITQKEIIADYDHVISPTSEWTCRIRSKNISQLALNIYRVNATAQEYLLFVNNNDHNYCRKVSYPNRTLIETKELSIPFDENFKQRVDTLKIAIKGFGIY
jgi:hypothetical protein